MVQQIVVSPCHQTEVPGQNLHLLKLQPKEGGIKLKKMKEQKKVKTNTFIHKKKSTSKLCILGIVKYMHSGRLPMLNKSAPSILGRCFRTSRKFFLPNSVTSLMAFYFIFFTLSAINLAFNDVHFPLLFHWNPLTPPPVQHSWHCYQRPY